MFCVLKDKYGISRIAYTDSLIYVSEWVVFRGTYEECQEYLG